MAMQSDWLRLHHVAKAYGDTPAVRDVSITVHQREILVLLGPSGCGKTTLLRLIAGLESADAGRILLASRPLADVPVHRRRFGFVFQDYALFPHMTVADNIAFGLRMEGLPRAAQADRVKELLDLVQLAALGDRPVQALSGGERQRVALARSLAPRPRLLLLDEPLGALDRALRERLMFDLRHILRQAAEDVTTIYVTHDHAEAFAIADRVAVMSDGRILQVDTARTLFDAPKNAFVARFLGLANLLPGTLIQLAPAVVRSDLGEWDLGRDAPAGSTLGAAVIILVRPEAAQPMAASEPIQLAVQVTDVLFRGRFTMVDTVTPEGIRLRFERPGFEPVPDVGSIWPIAIDPGAIRLLEPG